jgi:hypothetical protein
LQKNQESMKEHDSKSQKLKSVIVSSLNLTSWPQQFFLTNRTFTLWNGLSPETVNVLVSTVHAFKRMLDRNTYEYSI